MQHNPLRTLLIASRGEIALQVLRTAQVMGKRILFLHPKGTHGVLVELCAEIKP